ncbi:hypothetical protein DAPPUDRAFT_110377 [Daphnia pulex]|uniref:Uncharacterized protein n=1 Tax=Daphnia pulex TaxID=6669 RepID=E9H650_DAPPU|nr:hypothetical protein DAPPUDRAFT_110377 [Daphnia pulex]|eukprot:EFX72745.1 hypothetical protein DAPPUDRAFT_110377 [Daphnia pulex]
MGILHWIHRNLKLRNLQVMATFASLVANLAHRSALGFFSLYYPQSTGLVEASVALFVCDCDRCFSRERHSLTLFTTTWHITGLEWLGTFKRETAIIWPGSILLLATFDIQAHVKRHSGPGPEWSGPE